MNYTKEQAWELCLLALCAWREARDQGYQGMLAVCWAIKNRADNPGWWGKDFESVIEAKWQFSSFNPDDPNAKLLPGNPAVDAPWAAALQAAEMVYTNAVVDPTDGATHYHAADMNPYPSWVNSPKTHFLVQIGSHRFYVSTQ